MSLNEVLTFENHSRYFKECKYVYPVVSRRSQGVSLGINLNLNNACNWRCIYCQVDGLIRGKPAVINLTELEKELDTMLQWIINGDFLINFAPSGLQRLNDICLAGNGEPTLSPDFLAVCQLIVKLRQKYLLDNVKTVLITNGSQIHLPRIKDALKVLNNCNGEVWFKVDRATSEKVNLINQVLLNMETVGNHLVLSSMLCKTFIQSCWFNNYGNEPDIGDVAQFVDFIAKYKSNIAGVLLYSTARLPALPEGAEIAQCSDAFLYNLNEQILKLGIKSVYYI